MNEQLTQFMQLGGGVAVTQLVVYALKSFNVNDKYFSKNLYPLISLVIGLIVSLVVTIVLKASAIEFLTYLLLFASTPVMGYELTKQLSKTNE